MPAYFWKQRLIFDQVKIHSQERKGTLWDSALGWYIIHSFYHFFFFLPVLYLWRRGGEKIRRKENTNRNVSITACELSFSVRCKSNFRALEEKEALFQYCSQTRCVHCNSWLSNVSPTPQISTFNTVWGVCGRKVISSKHNGSISLFSMNDLSLDLSQITLLASSTESGAFHYQICPKKCFNGKTGQTNDLRWKRWHYRVCSPPFWTPSYSLINFNNVNFFSI